MHARRLRSLLSVFLALAFGAALRLWFIHSAFLFDGDSLLYGDIAKNWLLHGVYGLSSTGAHGVHRITATLIRLPGYPAFLALSFRIFGMENYRSVLYLQAAFGLAACLLVAAFVRRVCSIRAAEIALWVAALCPFTANYAAVPLTETLSIFSIALGFYAFACVLEDARWFSIMVLASACSLAALLRPDGVLLGVVLLSGLVFYGRRSPGLVRSLRVAAVCAGLALIPFVAWTLRNWRTFHVIQPLAPRSATDPGEFAAPGFDRWTKTWLIDFASTYEIYWNMPGSHADVHALPSRAFDTPEEWIRTRQLFEDYNRRQAFTPQVDAGFAMLASQRQRAHPWRSFVELPLLRLADMWLRPRTEMLNIEPRWWQDSGHPARIGFAIAYAFLNLAYLLAAAVGFLSWPKFRAAMAGYIVLRSLLLLTLAASEARYTLECFPLLEAFAAQALAHAFWSSKRPMEKHLSGHAQNPEGLGSGGFGSTALSKAGTLLQD